MEEQGLPTGFGYEAFRFAFKSGEINEGDLIQVKTPKRDIGYIVLNDGSIKIPAINSKNYDPKDILRYSYWEIVARNSDSHSGNSSGQESGLEESLELAEVE